MDNFMYLDEIVDDKVYLIDLFMENYKGFIVINDDYFYTTNLLEGD